MDVRILGALEMSEGGRQLSLGGTKQRAVLAVLILRANEVVSRDRLIDDVWGEQPPATVRTVLQGYISKLRKELPPETLLTRAPGYLLRIEPEQLDLHRFERLVADAEGTEPAKAAATLRTALSLWHGPALADLAYEPFAQTAIVRLEELRLAALEARIEADLALGRHGPLVAELEGLVAQHPLRERLRGQLMLALYRSGRQAEALALYREARTELVEQLGIEPSPALQALEQAILQQDAALDLAPVSVPDRSILVAPLDVGALDSLLALAEPLARVPPREVILAGLVAAGDDLTPVAALLHEQRDGLLDRGVGARAAAFTSGAPGDDLVRMAGEQDVDLLLIDGPPGLLEDLALRTVLAGAPCDVAVLIPRDEAVLSGPVLVPFGGADHDWAALELAAWISDAHGCPLRLAGVAADLEEGWRDASRLLARASLIAQKVTGVAAEPLLVERGAEGLVEAADEARLLVVGLPEAWRQAGHGSARLAVAGRTRTRTLLVRRGLRPGGIAPPESLTRFTWTLAGASR